MVIVGHGVDVIEISRIRTMVDRHGQRFLERVFTQGEQAYALAARDAAPRLAVRFAAKEAALKALGTGLRSGIAWTDVEVVLLPSGEPTLKLHDAALHAAQARGIRATHISLSHARDIAIASVIAEA